MMVEMVKDYNCINQYQPRKAKDVADALSQKENLRESRAKELENEIQNFNLEILDPENADLMTIIVQEMMNISSQKSAITKGNTKRSTFHTVLNTPGINKNVS